MNRYIDETGNKYGRLKVIEFAGKNKNNKAFWSCVCECDTRKIVDGRELRRGKVKSCGCLKRDVCKYRNSILAGEKSPTYKHGLSKTKEYQAMHASIKRNRKINQTPTLNGLEKEKVLMYYKISSYLGKEYQVDHKIPLSVGGSDHPDNLWIIPTTDNQRKSNSLNYELNHNLYFKI